MRLNNIEVYNFLLREGLTSLHHANSLATSITFVQNNGLLSRGAVEDKGLFQTSQLSDDDDRKNNVWHDIFFDTSDLHGHFPRQNIYGPILFKFDSSVLLNESLQIYITKINPLYWNPQTKEEDKYFQSVDEMANTWSDYELHRKMITIRFMDSILSFEHLQNIIVDNPGVTIYDDTILFNECYNAISQEVKKNSFLSDKLIIRQCSNCFCHENYLHQYGAPKLSKFFLPNTHRRFTNF